MEEVVAAFRRGIYFAAPESVGTWWALTVVALSIIAYRTFFADLVEETLLVVGDDSFHRKLLARMPSSSRFSPPTGFASPHAQIVGVGLFREKPNIKYHRQQLSLLRSGGHVTLDWYPGAPPEPSCLPPRDTRPYLLLLHGLTGGSHEAYAQWMVAMAAEQGFNCVVMNARGCSRSELSSPTTLSATWTHDVRDTVQHVRARIGRQARLYAVGYSLGAGILTKFVAEEGASCALDGAVACCAAFDLGLSTSTLESGLNRWTYNAMLTANLQKYLARHKEQFMGADSKVDVQAALAARTIREWDAAVIVPQYGYESTAAYYADGSTAGRVKHIGIPFLALNALDDPICPTSGLPRDAFRTNPNTMAILTPTGGHVGWLQAKAGKSSMCSLTPVFGASWDNAVICEWLVALTGMLEEKPSLVPGSVYRQQ